MHELPSPINAVVGAMYAALASLSTQLHMSPGAHVAVVALACGLSVLLKPRLGVVPPSEWPPLPLPAPLSAEAVRAVAAQVPAPPAQAQQPPTPPAA